jgi:hypothetical protein
MQDISTEPFKKNTDTCILVVLQKSELSIFMLPNGRQQKFLVITKINDQYTYIKFTEFNLNYSKLAKREVLVDQKYLRVKKYKIFKIDS